MKPHQPDICDLDGKPITSEKQYTFEVYEGRTAWFDSKGVRSKAKIKIDCCHACFMNICKNGYTPKFVKEQKNANYVKGSDKPEEKYSFILEEPDPQEQLKVPSTGAL